MGLRGIENGVTRFHQVRVPAAHRIGPEGAGLKIALTTLNTGRLSLPAMCAGVGKWCLKIAREWSTAREQWGKSIAKHEAVGGKVAFVAAHLSVAGALIDPDTSLADKGRAAARAGGFYARWLPQLITGPGQLPRTYQEFGELAGHLRYAERASRKLARSTFYAMSRWQG